MIKMYLFRIRCILRDKQNCFVILFAFLLSLLFVNALSSGAEERSNVPIGILDLDRSETSQSIVKHVKMVPAFYIYEEEEERLNKMLLDEEISGIFIIEEGLEKSIQAGSTSNLVTMKFLEGNSSVKVLSDIFAGQMLYPISLAKGLKEYENLKREYQFGNKANQEAEYNWFSKEEYMDYVNKLSEASDFDFAFDIHMMDVARENNKDSRLDNSVIYYQVIFGILSMLISFVAMFITSGVVVEKQQGIDKRIQITMMKPVILGISYILALLTILSVLSIGITMILYNSINIENMKTPIILFALLFLYAIIMGTWFLLMGKVTKKITQYQLLGTVSILLYGFLSFLSMLEGLMQNQGIGMTRILPNRWFMEGARDILFIDQLGEIPVNAFAGLLVIEVILIAINFGLGMVRNLRRRVFLN